LVITAEMLINLLMEGVSDRGFWAVAASGMGWLLFRNLWPRPGAAQVG
jgi:hypothetical protein